MLRIRQMSLAIAVALVPLSALADNVGGCGWGSKLFDGQSGVAPQVLAVTTNGTFWNQTFGITFGTSGCSKDGTVNSNWKTAAYIDGNKDKLARDMSRGAGESLDSLLQLVGVSADDKARFVALTRDNVGRIFPNANASTDEIRTGLREVLAADAKLAVYSANI